ncbi:MAG: PfkB family carbohydrate kinase [Salibacteraceae bacterium]
MKLTDQVTEFTEAVKDLRVAIVGETIIDEFIPCIYEGQSMKSFCPVFKLAGNKEEQQGGATAIGNHLRDFVKEVVLVTNTEKEIVKTRYIDVDGGKKHVEVNKFDTAGFQPVRLDCSGYDVVIVADFGHGFLNDAHFEGAFHLMCQTNSNNFGFNRVSKWKNYHKKSVCLDLREASLQMNQKIRFSTHEELLALYNYELDTENLFVTLGGKGSVHTDGKTIHPQPAFKSKIVDTIGAGDTFYGFACLAAHLGLPNERLLTLPSLAASLSTTWLCNEKSVTPNGLLDYATHFLP